MSREINSLPLSIQPITEGQMSDHEGDVTGECLAAVPDTSICGRSVVRELIAQRGKPGMIVSDNGMELTSNAVLAWCREIGCTDM